MSHNKSSSHEVKWLYLLNVKCIYLLVVAYASCFCFQLNCVMRPKVGDVAIYYTQRLSFDIGATAYLISALRRYLYVEDKDLRQLLKS